jgi:methylglyoxal synthase
MAEQKRVKRTKCIALVAHDNKKAELLEWAAVHKERLAQHELCGTGTTGKLLESALGVPVKKFLSGPLGGDQQIGADIAEGKIDILIFFWDSLEPQPHDPDVKALLRLAVLWNIPFANNRATADFILTSPLLTTEYERKSADYDRYVSIHRAVLRKESEPTAK